MYRPIIWMAVSRDCQKPTPNSGLSTNVIGLSGLVAMI